MKVFHSRVTLMFVFCLLGVFQADSVYSYPGGITGYSGSHGVTCSKCHPGGAGDVSLTLEAVSGSTTVLAGSTSSYTLTFSGDTGTGGFDIAAPDGDLVLTDPLSRLSNFELVHTKPNYVSTVKFDWKAPDTAGTYKLYAATYYNGQKNSYLRNTTLTINVTPKSGSTTITPATSSSGGGGGCSLNPRASFDPLFPLLFVIAGLYFYKRKYGKRGQNTVFSNIRNN